MNTNVLHANAARASNYSTLLGSIAGTAKLDQHFIHEGSSNLHDRVIDAGFGPGHWAAFLHEVGVEGKLGVGPVNPFIDQTGTSFPGVPFRVVSLTTWTRLRGKQSGSSPGTH